MDSSARLPLLPAQGWFLEDLYPGQLNPARWTLARLYRLPAGLPREPVEAAVRELWRRHDALRIRLIRTPAGWCQEVLNGQTPEPFRFVDLSRVPPAQQRAEIERMTAELHATLNLEAGPMARFAHLYLGSDRPGRLFVNIHHLAADGMAYTLLQSELDSLLAGSTAGTAVRLPSAARYQDCVEAVADYARSPEVLDELDHWRRQPWESIVDLPRDGPAHTPYTARQWTTVRSTMRGPEVPALTQRLPGVLGVDLTDIILAGVAETLTRCSGGTIGVRTVHHGRNLRRGDAGARVPVLPRRAARTVGWLSTFGFLIVEPRTEPDPGDYLRRVAAAATAAPNRGTGLCLLRHVTPPGAHTELVTRIWRREQAMFNFGAMGTRPADDEVLGVADEAIGHRPDPLEPRLPLHIRAHTAGDELTVLWDYDPWVRREETVAALAEQCREALVSYARTVS
jgi:hypothetical protein